MRSTSRSDPLHSPCWAKNSYAVHSRSDWVGPLKCEIEKAVGALALGGTVAEVGEHAVVEAGIVQLHGHRVREVAAVTDSLGRPPV